MTVGYRVSDVRWLGLSIAVTGWIFLAATGVPLVSAAALVAIVTVQVVAGMAVWCGIRGSRASAVEIAGMGMAIGTVLATVSGLVLLITTGQRWGWALPALVVAVVWGVRRWQHVVGERASHRLDRGSLVALPVAAGLGIASLVPNLLSYPLAWTGIWSRYHADMLFFESLSTSLARLGPFDSIYTPDAVVRYHWLVYAWSGQVADAAGAAPFVVLTRVLPFVAVAGAALVGIAWGARLSAAVWVPSLAVVLLVMGGYVGATYGAIFNFDSPSQSMTSMWLLSFALAVSVILSRDVLTRSWGARFGQVLVVGLMAFGLAGGKISAGAVGIGGVLWVVLVGLMRRTDWRVRALWVGGASAGGFILGYVLIVAGSADPGGLKLGNLIDRASSIQGLNPVAGSVGILVGTLILATAIAVRWSGLVWFLADSERRWQPDVVLGVGLALAATGTVLLVSGGMNDTWFALAASAPLAVISAAGAGEAWTSLGSRRRPALGWSVAVASAIFLVVTLLWLSGASGGNVFVSTWRWAGPLVGLAVAIIAGVAIGRHFGGAATKSGLAGSVIVLVLLSAPGRALGVGSGQVGVQPGLGEDAFSPIISFTQAIDRTLIREWSDQHLEAAEWLREQAAEGDLVGTNVTFSPFVPALTGLRTYASGILYQAPYGRPAGVPILLEREKDSWAFVNGPSASTVTPLCDAGVIWLWVDPTRTEVREWGPFAAVEFANDAAIILTLDRSVCPAG